MSYRNRVALFVLSILIPATVLAALGAQLYSQQRELILRRLAAEQSEPLDRLRAEGPQFQARVESVFRESKLRFAFYAAVILFAFSITLFSRYVVWKAFREEGLAAELRSQFVSNVSHELRTPLTSIQMFAETLALGRVKDAASQTRYLETIARESRRLARLVDHVLAFTQVETGSVRYKKERIALGPVLEAAMDMLQQPLQHSGFRVALSLPVEALEVHGDNDALEQAVLNVLTNAMKYSGDARDLHIKLARNGKEAVIEIADHGIGIPAEHRGRIVERFFRVPLPEHQAVSGVGIGLTLVEGILNAHEGRLEVRENTPKGSVFALRLPLATNS